MPAIAVKYSLGLTTLKSQAVQFKVEGQIREIVLPAGKVISQQLIDIVVKVASPEYEVIVAPVVGLQDIVEGNRRRVDSSQQGGSPVMLATMYDADVTLFEQGDKSNEIYILNSGSVSVLVNGTQVATINEKGAYIGELSILTGVARSATITTLETCTFSIIPGAKLEAAIQQVPSVGYKLAVLLATRLKQTNQKAVTATMKLNAYGERLKTLAEEMNVFLQHGTNPLIADLKRKLKHPELLDEAGIVDTKRLLS